MRIVHVTPAAVFQRGERGGGQRYFAEFVTALDKPGVESRIYLVPNLFSVHEVSLDTFETRPTSLRELHAQIHAADVTHVHHLNSPAFDHALFAAVRGGPPIVLSDYGGGYLTPGRALGRLRIPRIRGLAAISKWSVQDIDPRNEIKDVAVIYGGGDHILRRPGAYASEHQTDFLFVGRLLPHKGAHVAIEALPPGASLTVAGETLDSSYFAHLKALAEGKHVNFIGSPDDDLLPTLYRSAKFCVLPSVYSYGSQTFTRPELLGLVVLEAMACGTPVIGSAVCGLTEVLEMAGQYSARAGDVADWNAVMSQALAAPRGTPPSLFTWNSAAESTHELYERIVSSTP